jgi:hypothetical protein
MSCIIAAGHLVEYGMEALEPKDSPPQDESETIDLYATRSHGIQVHRRIVQPSAASTDQNIIRFQFLFPYQLTSIKGHLYAYVELISYYVVLESS